MGLPAVLLINALVTTGIAAGIFVWWIASRRRIAEDTVGLAQREAERLVKAAERDAETLRKEAAIEAREQAHALATDMSAGSFRRTFLQMRGDFTLRGRVGGSSLEDEGQGFFETYLTR